MITLSKKTLISAVLLALTTPLAFAAKYKDQVAAPLSLRDGFYLGLQGGYDSYHVKETDNTGAGTASTTMSPTGWVGGGFAGYGMNLKSFYLGGEVFINGSSAQASNSFSNAAVVGQQKFTVNTSYGLAILPGYYFTPATLSYIRLGYNWVQLKVSESLTGTSDNFSATGNNTSGGMVFGVGIETLIPEICDHVSLRGEYTYTNYNSFKPTGGQIQFSPYDYQFMLSLIYHI